MGKVDLQAVSFAYPSRPNVLVLKAFDLHVPPGQAAALVGESGSGKSTIVGLLLRFYDTQGGKVRVWVGGRVCWSFGGGAGG